jgi:hypothetical protein
MSGGNAFWGVYLLFRVHASRQVLGHDFSLPVAQFSQRRILYPLSLIQQSVVS